MASAHHPAQPHPYSLPPPMQNAEFRLPSLKDLNFQYRPPPSQDSAPPPSNSSQSEHPSQTSNHLSRHEWARSHPSQSSPSHMQHPQHPSSMVNGHDHSSRPEPPYGQSGMSHMQQAQGPISAGLPPRDAESAQKRPRSTATTVGVSPRSSHNGYSQHPPQYSSQPPQPPSYISQAGPPPPEQTHHPSFQQGLPPPGYQNYPPYMAQRLPAPPGHPHQQPLGNPYPPPPASHSAEHWQQQQQQQQQHQQQQHQQQHQQQQQQQQQQHAVQHPQPPPPVVAYSKPTALVPTAVEARTLNPPRPDREKVSQRQDTMAEILRHCEALYSFATRYAQMQASRPEAQPTTAELTEMGQHANSVVRLLEDLRRLSLSEQELAKDVGVTAPEESRPPKRPWEDMTADTPPDAGVSLAEAQSTAEADMALIRTKRATTSGQNGGPGQPKSKYRKRSRATPPGKCHSCNIRETPEWRRGPDGARTLCNACGLHYAKLMRKRDKASGADGSKPPVIDLETLRASTRMQDQATLPGGPNDPPSSANSNADTNPTLSLPPSQAVEPLQPSPALTKSSSLPSPLSPVGGGYGLVPVSNPGPGIPPHPHHHQQMMPPPPLPGNAGENQQGGAPPPPPWAQAQQQQQHGRAYQPEHQSFIRAHQPPHARGSAQYRS